MSDNVISLSGGRPCQLGEPRPELIGVLENLLGKAKSGQLQSFVGTGFTSGGERVAAWVNTHENVYEMLGSIARLEHEYVHRTTGGDAA